MKDSNKVALVSLIYAASISTSAQPVFCAETIESAQARLQQMETVKEQHPGGYAHALFTLAEAYYANREDAHAEITFRQCLPFYFSSSTTYKEGAYAAALLNWAGVLLRGNGPPANFSKIDSLILEALDEIDKVADKLSRAQTYQGAILLFSKTGNIKEEQRCIRFLLDSCSECEANKDANPTQIRRASTTLSWIAQRSYPLKPSALQSKPPADDEVAEEDLNNDQFDVAERLVIRAINLCDRSIELKQEKRWLHRLLARWYAAQGKFELADEQEKLAKKLAPSKDLRTITGCGRTRGKVTGAGVISGACGMG